MSALTRKSESRLNRTATSDSRSMIHLPRFMCFCCLLYTSLISYSNANFYRGKLQVMKIRGKGIDEVFRFTILPTSSDELARKNRNINQQEAQFIVAELLKLKEHGSKVSVCLLYTSSADSRLYRFSSAQSGTVPNRCLNISTLTASASSSVRFETLWP